MDAYDRMMMNVALDNALDEAAARHSLGTVATATLPWLMGQHKRIGQAQAHDQRVRTAPDEVVHRRVDGVTVINRRLLHRRTTNPPAQIGVEDEIERARRYT